MKIVVISDTHGDISWFDKLKPAFDSADCIFHLGDYASDAKKIESKLNCPIYCVRGNCDVGVDCESEILQNVCGVNVMAVHGNRYRVDHDLYALSADARSKEAGICLYGHTHVPDVTNFYGIWFVNPGSLSRPRGMSKKSFAVIERDRYGNICPTIVEIESL